MDKSPPNLQTTNHNQEGTLPEVWFKGQTTQSTFLGFKTRAQIHTPSSLRVKPRLTCHMLTQKKPRKPKQEHLFGLQNRKPGKKQFDEKTNKQTTTTPKNAEQDLWVMWLGPLMGATLAAAIHPAFKPRAPAASDAKHQAWGA